MHRVAAEARRLLVIEPCEECRALFPSLCAAGWQVESRSLNEAGQHPCQVGMLCFHSGLLPRLDEIKAVIASNVAEWVALVSAKDMSKAKLCDFISEWFFDFHTMPVDLERLLVTLGRACGMAHLREQNDNCLADESHELLGESASIRSLRKLMEKLGSTDSPVLIRGESGTGKELVARSLHRTSARVERPSVAINCGAIPENLIQSELFGHEKGAFTGAHQRKIGRIESADGGTLFLDEIGDLPMEMQANLLRFLQEMTIERVGGSKSISVNVRVIAATHINLEEAVAKGTFREDLYYRLNVLQVHVPPLRERIQDVPQLASHFASLFSVEAGRRPRRFSQAALLAMASHHWPGNVRELANRVRRGLVIAEGKQIEAEDIGLERVIKRPPLLGTLEDYKLRAERQAVGDALMQHSQNLSQAARALGISRPTLYRLLHKHQLSGAG
ncbi:sigma-54 dependent transcriptional regulator [Pseudomonas sp. TMP25]|uniref:sigma-54 dependent transcriptional regulator n=1 Tax=Pseudomonas sp. TMP25 TaxID=3136561 RepID=UPI0031014142